MRFTRLMALMALFFVPMTAEYLYSQALKDDKKPGSTAVRKDTSPVVYNSMENEDFYKMYPGIGLLMGINKPMGGIGAVLGLGYGGLITAQLPLPIRFGSSLHTAARLQTGYYTLPGSGGDFTGTVSMIPFLISFEMFFFTEGGIRPYFSLGGGASYLTLEGDTGKSKISNRSAVDGTLAFNFGLGYSFKGMPDIEYVLNYSYLLVVESVMGQFSMVSLGAVYRFGKAPKTADKSKISAGENVSDKNKPVRKDAQASGEGRDKVKK